MSNIVISGYYGFGNAGDEAMLCAIIDAIRDVEGDILRLYQVILMKLVESIILRQLEHLLPSVYLMP